MTNGRATDACAFHEWASVKTLLPYMPENWQELILQRNDLLGPLNVKSHWVIDHPLGATEPGTAPKVGLPGSDFDLFAEHLLADGQRDRVVVGYHEGLLSTAYPLPYVTRQVMRAANDWTIDQWLARDERVFGHVLVSTSMPAEAAAEIRRVGGHEQMVAVALGTNGLGRPFGHFAYHPIFEAASELDLPLVLQVGCDSASDLVTPPTAFGVPDTYAEYDVLGAQGMMAHTASLIMAGVFDVYPNLNVLLVGGGAAWAPWFTWNMDFLFRYMRRIEAPWATATPSEYFAKHFRLSTHSLESPKQPERLAQVLGTLPEAESMLLYASGYPRRGWEQPDSIAARLPESWHERVFHTNAEEFYRWPGKTSSREPASAEGREAMLLP